MELLECELMLDSGPEMVFRIRISGDYWARAETQSYEGTAPDFGVVLQQVIFRREWLVDLIRDFERWLDTGQPFSCRFEGYGGGQIICMSLGDDPRFVRSTHKAVFALTYTSGLVMNSGCSFVIDQTCVRMAVEGISTCLAVR
ncbi:hypothetical protein [Stenotrophomonas sp. 24(2023)]|uniref:hypothetical protein n=1 Tax=Stenotrophomonas sp. 24(2023) TaxID=3068324 RepID=UPI0027DF04E9|nr:hypothetical protein [Stenotrophomonas sp. 24(2023)]WMJ68354.1 hypothetical protein Q9R17_14265 [Stenotrophomonas sp. 24(2023)]